MTFPDYIARVEAANPRLFAATEIKVKVSVLRDQLERAYRAGAAHKEPSVFDQIFPKLNKRGPK